MRPHQRSHRTRPAGPRYLGLSLVFVGLLVLIGLALLVSVLDGPR